MWRWVVMVALCIGCRESSRHESRNAEQQRCAKTVDELQRFARDLASVARQSAGRNMRRLADVPSGQRVPEGISVSMNNEVTVQGHMIATPYAWTDAKTAAVEAKLRALFVRLTAAGDPIPPVLVIAWHDIEWQAVAGVMQAAVRAGFAPQPVFRAPLGVREPAPSWVTEQVDAAADQIYDLLPVILKYERLAADDEPSKFSAIQRGFKDAWQGCPLPPSPPLTWKEGSGREQARPAWERWLTEDVPAAVATCRCNVDPVVAEGFIWALLGAPRYKLVTRAVNVTLDAAAGDAVAIEAPAAAPWSSVAAKLPASAEQPVRVMVQ